MANPGAGEHHFPRQTNKGGHMIASFARMVLVAVSAALTGCASVPEASLELDTAAKAFSAPRDKAGVYIFRNEVFGAAIKLDVFLDGKWLGETASKTYFYVEVDPGRHTVMGKGENQSEVSLEALVGRLYYVWQEVKMGLLQPRNELKLVEEDVGRAGVMESKRIAQK
jgi:hypothetical protein